MKIHNINVEDIPEVKSGRHKDEDSAHITATLEEFLGSGAKAGRVEWDHTEFVRYDIVYNCMHKICRGDRMPLKILMRGQSIYIIRTDI